MQNSSSGRRTTSEGAQRPISTTTGPDSARRPAAAVSSRASPAPALAPAALALAPPPSLSPGPSPPSFRRGKWNDAEYEEVWRLGHTYILASAQSQSSPPSPSPSSSIATPSPPPPPPSSTTTTPVGAGAGSVQDWENLRYHPEGLMKTQAKLRSASALRTMFLKMRKESLLQQQQQHQQQEQATSLPASTRSSGVGGGGGGGTRADDLAFPSSFSSSSSTFRVRFKSHVFEPSSSRTTVPAAGVVVVPTAAPSSAAASAADEEEKGGEEEATRDAWTPAEDAVLLAAMITLPNTVALVASASATSAAGGGGGSGKEDQAQAQQVAVRGLESHKSAEEEIEQVEEASTPLARAAAWPPTTPSGITSGNPPQQSHIADRSTTATTTTTTAAAHGSLTTSAEWLKVHEIAERTYRIMEAGTAQQAGEAQGGGGGATKRTRRLRRDVKELENRWRTKWRVDGITKNLAAPELLLPAIRQQSDVLSKLSVEVLTELSSSSRRNGGAATAVAAVDTSPRSGSSAPFAVQQQQQQPEEEQTESSAPITRSDSKRRDAGRQEEDDDPRAAYPTPAPGSDALPQNDNVEDNGRADPGLPGIDEMDELQRSVTMATTRTPNMLEPAPPPPPPETSAPDDAQVQDRQLSTPAAPQTAATANVNKMIGLGLDLGGGIGTGLGLGQVQQPETRPPQPLYNNSSAIPTANLTGTEELDSDRGDVRFTTTTTIPLRRASSSAVLTSPSPSPLPAAFLLPSRSSILSANRAATSFAPFTELYKPPSNVDALRHAHQSQPQPQPLLPVPFQMYFQPKPRPLMPFSAESPPSQQQEQQQQPVSLVHSLQSSMSASVSYRPFSRVLTTPTTTATTDPPPSSSSSHRDMANMHGPLASSASSSSRGHSFLGTVQEEGLSPRPPQNVEQPPDHQAPQVRPLLPTISSGDDRDRQYDRGTKRRWSEADLYACSPIYLYETSLGPPHPHPQQQDTRSSWPWTLGTEPAGGPMDQQRQRQRQPNALDRAIAAGRPLADYSSSFDQDGDENDQDQDGDSAFTHQQPGRDEHG